MAKFSLSNADKTRYKITKTQAKSINKMYSKMYDNIKKSIDEESKKTSISSQMRTGYLKELEQQIVVESKNISQQLGVEIPKNMFNAAQAVTQTSGNFAQGLGLEISPKMSRVSTDVVANIMGGTIYKKPWSFSGALWSDLQHTQKDIQFIVAQGTAMNKSAFDIAKDLEKYVNPSAKKDWDWSKVYPGTRKTIDYNAQRLARTMVSHSYQQSIVANTKPNPFVTGLRWDASNSVRTCAICHDRDGQVYKKEELPLDHPNGMCTYEAVMMDDENIENMLANWVNGEDNSQLDQYASYLNGDSVPQSNVQSSKTVSTAPVTKTVSEANPQQGMPTSVIEQTVEAPDTSKWILNMHSQTEAQMLETEESNFKKFTDSQKIAIKRYTGSSFGEMNTYLRNIKSGMSEQEARRKSKVDELLVNQIQEIKTALGSSSLSNKDVYLRRGTDLGDLAGFMSGDFETNKWNLYDLTVEQLNEKFAGTIGEYAGFTSTSSLYEKGFNGSVEIIFHAPPETQASSIMKISRYGTDEGETLLNASTKVKIIKIEESEDRHMYSNIRVFMEILA